MTITISFPYTRTTRAATPRRLSRTSDGDTPVIEQPIRMVSCDTPEKAHYAGRPEVSQVKLNTCRERLASGFYDEIPAELRQYLITRLTTDAAERHIAAGNQASQVFDDLLQQRLTRPNGTMRRIASIPTGQLIDSHGRLLAYIVPWFSGSQNDPVPERDSPDRRTFNLDMIENGWAAFFPIYPSLPRDSDMNLAIANAATAWDARNGIWKEFGEEVLLAYEFRMCIKLGTTKTAEKGIISAFQRICIDLRDLTEKGLYGWYSVPPPYRLWVWSDEIAQARSDLGL